MKLRSTRGWEEFEWILVKRDSINIQTTLIFKTLFWDRAELINGNLNDLVKDSTCKFSQVIIRTDDFDSWINYIDELAARDLKDLTIGDERNFEFILNPSEALFLRLSDHEQGGYNLLIELRRGKINFRFEVHTDITCLTNFCNSMDE